MPNPLDTWPQVAPQWMLDAPRWLENFFFRFYQSFIFDSRYVLFLRGLGNTLLLTFFALLLGVALGVVISLIRVTWDKNSTNLRGPGKAALGFFNGFARIYLTIIRGTPTVVQVFIMFFVIFATSKNKLLVGSLTFGINSGAYVAEIIRAGIMSLDAGQEEAGRSLGFGYVPTMRHIILPQAFKAVLPALGNELIVLIKETAVVGWIGMPDIMYAALSVGGVTYQYLFPLVAAALIYLALVMILTWLQGKLERKLRVSESHSPVKKPGIGAGVFRLRGGVK
ncbi:MAG: amino acid ABC transporter permease [Firmicutes bacterium]|nr:amino acid ABC transporter permease [Bacillota bacterium]